MLTMKVAVVGDVTPSETEMFRKNPQYPEDGCSTFIRNAGTYETTWRH
jgi:hypothetical protein